MAAPDELYGHCPDTALSELSGYRGEAYREIYKEVSGHWKRGLSGKRTVTYKERYTGADTER